MQNEKIAAQLALHPLRSIPSSSSGQIRKWHQGKVNLLMLCLTLLRLPTMLQIARFVKVYRSHKLCRNHHSHKGCGNASGISPSYKGYGN